RQLPELGPRFAAVLDARETLLSGSFLDHASEAEFQTALLRFHEACARPPLYAETLRRRAGVVRHALAHLLRCPDPLPHKAERCLAPEGAYHVAGLGLAFWSALFQALDPGRNPGWTPGIEAGLRRLGLARWRPQARPARLYPALARLCAQLRADWPGLGAQHFDHFFALVGRMEGRDLWAAPPAADLATVIAQARAGGPLRQRLKDRGHVLRQARTDLEVGLAAHDGPRILAALAAADSEGAARAPIDATVHAEALVEWVGRLWQSAEPYDDLTAFWRA